MCTCNSKRWQVSHFFLAFLQQLQTFIIKTFTTLSCVLLLLKQSFIHSRFFLSVVSVINFNATTAPNLIGHSQTRNCNQLNWEYSEWVNPHCCLAVSCVLCPVSCTHTLQLLQQCALVLAVLGGGLLLCLVARLLRQLHLLLEGADLSHQGVLRLLSLPDQVEVTLQLRHVLRLEAWHVLVKLRLLPLQVRLHPGDTRLGQHWLSMGQMSVTVYTFTAQNHTICVQQHPMESGIPLGSIT